MGNWLNVPPTDSYESEMSKSSILSNLSADMLLCMNTIILGICGRLFQGTFFECKAQNCVASMTDLIIVWRGFRETIKRLHCLQK